jgi:hypothetical protein
LRVDRQHRRVHIGGVVPSLLTFELVRTPQSVGNRLQALAGLDAAQAVRHLGCAGPQPGGAFEGGSRNRPLVVIRSGEAF